MISLAMFNWSWYELG